MQNLTPLDEEAMKKSEEQVAQGEEGMQSEETAAQSKELTREEVVTVIKTVFDPEIPVDIWELGLIYEVSIYPINNVFIRMTLTSPACPAAGVLPGEVENKIKQIEGVKEVHLELVFDPPWNKEMMSEAATLELGFM